MYKCLKCGNTYKFIGVVKEEGNAIIYQNPDEQNKDDSITWAIKTSDSEYKNTHSVKRCFYCNSTEIYQT
jgi:DNA-directed RNA polymerase subunit RPC12/RpoP